MAAKNVPEAKRAIQAELGKQWIDAADSRIRSQPADLNRWWCVFNDPVLDELMHVARRHNVKLQQAGMRVARVRAEAAVAVCDMLKELKCFGGSGIIHGPAAGKNSLPTPGLFGCCSAVFNLADDLAFFSGRFARTVMAAEARVDAAVDDYDEILVALQGDVASNYVFVRQFQEQCERFKKNVQLQTDVMKIVQATVDNGRTSELDRDEAEAILSQTEAKVLQLETQLRQAENRLCVLIGNPPTDLQLQLGAAAVPDSPSEAAVGTPRELLQRRLDIHRAEQDTPLHYRDVVLRASEEAENGIVSYLRAQDQAKRLVAGLKSADMACRIAISQYQVGTIDFVSVAKIEGNLVELANQETEARAQIALGLIQVYRALGGGWQNRFGQVNLPLPPAASKPKDTLLPGMAPRPPAPVPGALRPAKSPLPQGTAMPPQVPLSPQSPPGS